MVQAFPEHKCRHFLDLRCRPTKAIDAGSGCERVRRPLNGRILNLNQRHTDFQSAQALDCGSPTRLFARYGRSFAS